MHKEELLSFFYKVFFPLWVIIGSFGIYYFYKLGSQYGDVLKRTKTKKIKHIKFRSFSTDDDFEEDLADQEDSEDYKQLVEFQRKGLIIFFWILGLYILGIIFAFLLKFYRWQ
ncbi:MAG: hypothetical protein ACO20H_09460 [Bacteriovoracaceae bacterium]